MDDMNTTNAESNSVRASATRRPHQHRSDIVILKNRRAVAREAVRESLERPVYCEPTRQPAREVVL